jgi:hypothetical protein
MEICPVCFVSSHARYFLLSYSDSDSRIKYFVHSYNLLIILLVGKNDITGMGIVVHACNTSYSGVKDRRITVQGHLDHFFFLFEKEMKSKKELGA